MAEGDRVVTRWTARGTHGGEFAGVPATDRAVEIPIIAVWRVDEVDQAVEDWTLWDRLGVLQQLVAATRQARPAAPATAPCPGR